MHLAGLAILSALIVLSDTAMAQRAEWSYGRAVITDSSGRFVFPRDNRVSYTWDVPVKGASPGSAEFMWELNWSRESVVDGRDPFGLWLTTRWKRGGPHRGSLSELVRGHTLDPMINCTSCDGVVYVDQQRDTSAVFATVEAGRVVFNIRGRDAVHRIFPIPPRTVTFTTSVRQNPSSGSFTGDQTKVQQVIVNCAAAADPRRIDACVIRPVVTKALPNADSAADENAPRRAYVPVVRFTNATLMKHVNVRVKTLYGKVWKVLSTGSLGAVRLEQAPLGPLLVEALCPTRSNEAVAISGTTFLQIVPRQEISVPLMADPSVCPR